MSLSRRRSTVLAATLFVASGALGLGYELLWIRKAALVVGSSQLALSTVLSAFFVGLASGSYVVGRFVRARRRSLLVLYGVCEIAIGVSALLLPLSFAAASSVYTALYPVVAGSPASLFGIRFLLLFVLFLPPTFLMGGTLPLLLGGTAHDPRSVGSLASLLYALNVLGAVAGVLATSFVAVPLLGLNASSVVAGLANIALGTVAVVWFRHEPATSGVSTPPPLGRFLPAAALLSGLVALGCQVSWARYFSLIHFSSAHTTAMLLAVYLLALAAGSFALAPLLRRGFQPLRLFATAQAAVPGAIWACLGAWRLADYRFAVRREWVDGQAVPAATLEPALDHPALWRFVGETPDALFFAPMFQLSLTMALPVALLGACLPALIAAAARTPEQLQSVSGRLIFFNTLGASAGSFLAGYVFLPWLGLHGTWVGLGALSVALAAAAMLQCKGSAWLRLAIPVAGAVGLVSGALVLPDVTRETIRRQQAGRDASGSRVVEVVEGPLASAYLLDDGRTLRMGTGAVQMGHVVRGAVNLQVIEGHLPVLLFPGDAFPKDCLGLCLGSGQSFGALLRYPLQRLDVVEIAGEILSIARGSLAPHNGGLATDPRVRLHVDDARHFVARAPNQSYDVVSMESPPPIADGAHNLYTTEFYREVRRVLRPGGVFMQFVPLYFLTPTDVRSVLRTLASEFDQVFVLRVSYGDFMVLAYPRPPRVPWAALQARASIFAGEWSSRGLDAAPWFADSPHPIASPEGILAMIVSGPGDVRRLTSGVILRDDRPLLSYTTGDRWLTRRYMGPTLTTLSLPALPIGDIGAWRDIVTPPLTEPQIESLAEIRAGMFRAYGMPHPQEVRRREVSLELAVEPGDRARRALDLALTYDAALRKEDALQALDTCLRTLVQAPDRYRDEWESPALSVVRSRLAVHERLVLGWATGLSRRHPGVPLTASIERELAAYRSRIDEVERRFIFR